jgi:ferredoxin/flavodoxin
MLIAVATSATVGAMEKIAKAFDLVSPSGNPPAPETNYEGFVPQSTLVRADAKNLKGIVVYYSATGSTAKVAAAIHRGMQSVMPCDVASTKKLKPAEMAKYDVVAIGAPIWLHREPANVRLFTYRMPRMDGKMAILFCSHGTQPFSIFWGMSRNLLRKGMTIIGWNDWYGDATHVVHNREPYITHGHPDVVDLNEAEAFGREMALRAQRIAAGEKNLIPEIPTTNETATLFTPHRSLGTIVYGGLPPTRPGSPPADAVPKFDLSRCVYPRCSACMDNCPANAIDVEILSSAGMAKTATLVVKEACQHCGGFCQRMCDYDAITYDGERTNHAIDMSKCIYPKCSLCADQCCMNAIDFSTRPPIVHNRCEGCDVCWCVCPVDGASLITNLPRSQYLHIPTNELPPDIVKKYNLKDPPGMENRGVGGVVRPEAGGPSGGMSQAMMMPKFRQLIPNDQIGKGGLVLLNPHAPRVGNDPKYWPYEMNGKQMGTGL